MKKLKYILFGIIVTVILPMLFTGCTRTVYVDSNTNEVVEVRKVESSDFIKLQRLDYDLDYPFIYVDTYTDVLYAVYPHKMSAIMKADGTCLTYTEWKERNK